MAYDTISLQSPYLDNETAEKLEQACILRQGVEVKSGEIIYSLTSGSLEGSYDNRIRINVQRAEYQKDEFSNEILVSAPYVIIEGSVHKALLGHNVFGGPQYFKASCRFFINLISELVGVHLPVADQWTVRRVDVAEVYELPSFEACSEWFRCLNSSEYPRRKVTRYDVSGLYSAGSTTTQKHYHKGPELRKHDRLRLIKYLSSEQYFKLLEYANKIVRVEVEVKARKLKYDFGYLPKVFELSDEYLNNIYDVEVKKLLKEGVSKMEIVKKARDVENRLYSLYNSSLAGVLLGFWYRLAALGDALVKQKMNKATFYRQRKKLMEAGVSWNGSDVYLNEFTLIPQGFSPVRSDVRRLSVQSNAVSLKLLPYMKETELQIVS